MASRNSERLKVIDTIWLIPQKCSDCSKRHQRAAVEVGDLWETTQISWEANKDGLDEGCGSEDQDLKDSESEEPK